MNLEESNAFSNYSDLAKAEYEKQKAQEAKEVRIFAENFIRNNQEYEDVYDQHKEFFDKHIEKELLYRLNVILPNSPYYDMNYMAGLRHGLNSIKEVALQVKQYRKQLKEEI